MTEKECPIKRRKLNLSDDEAGNDGKVDTTSSTSQDAEYFKSYADIGIHEEMLNDAVRTNAYRYAILKNYEKIRGKIVADVGAGTGILSVFCVQAGAKKVYAIEGSSLASQTKLVVAENKMSDRITVLAGKAEEVILPEKVDVIVSEWMGYSLLYESMLPSVLYVRDRWLKQGGLMLPSSASLYIAPFFDEDLHERIDMWSSIKSKYKVSMECMKSYSRKCITNCVHVRCLSPEDILSHGQMVTKLDLQNVNSVEAQYIQKDFDLICFGSSTVHGFALWFTVAFPGEITLTTSPYTEETHWGQTLMYIDPPVHVEQDTHLNGKLSIKPNKDKPRFLDVNLTYQKNDEQAHHKYYYMNDSIT